jgi:hypothetical protein
MKALNKLFLAVFIIGIFFAGVTANAEQLAILYTAGTKGYVGPCG